MDELDADVDQYGLRSSNGHLYDRDSRSRLARIDRELASLRGQFSSDAADRKPPSIGPLGFVLTMAIIVFAMARAIAGFRIEQADVALAVVILIAILTLSLAVARVVVRWVERMAIERNESEFAELHANRQESPAAPKPEDGQR
jgi:cob(I)alamin adenosyltransferase